MENLSDELTIEIRPIQVNESATETMNVLNMLTHSIL